MDNSTSSSAPRVKTKEERKEIIEKVRGLIEKNKMLRKKIAESLEADHKQ